MGDQTNDSLQIRGRVEILLDHEGGRDRWVIPNTVLLNGKRAVVRSLAYDIGGSFTNYIDRMVFGDGGEESGVPKAVKASYTGLFGTARAAVTATASLLPDVVNQVVYTSVLTPSHAVGFTLNEAALQMANGGFFSLVTFPGIPKTPSLTLTFNWTLTVI